MRCDNVGRGCYWEGSVGTLDDHVTKCEFTLVSCPNKCEVEGDDLQLIRKVLDDHLKTTCPNRDYECEHCGEKGTYASITEEHDQVCANKLIPCLNTECTVTMERGKFMEHICMFTEVTCKYHNIGCNVRKVRMHMKQHEEEDDKAHLHLALEKIVELDSMVSLSQSENASLMTAMFHDISSLKDTTTSLIKKFDNTVSSSNGNITSLRASLSSVVKTTTSLRKATTSLKKTTTSLKQTTTSLEKTTTSLEKTTTSLKKDVDVINKRESFTFKISDYSLLKEENQTYYSEPFYTSCDGYRIHIVVDPNGSDGCEATHVSVYVKLLKGSNDQKLQWPFLGTVTVELLNQLADDDHHSRMISFDLGDNVRVGIAYGHPDFIPHWPHSNLFHDLARNAQYLVDDTLYFRVTVKVKGHMPWLECTHEAK